MVQTDAPPDHPRNDERSQPGCRNISFDEKSGRTDRDRLTMTGPQLPVEENRQLHHETALIFFCRLMTPRKRLGKRVG